MKLSRTQIIILIAALVTGFLVGYSAAHDGAKIITNRFNIFKLTERTEHPHNTPIYDLSFVAYDKGFADEFGLEPAHITEMDEGLRWMEVRMITEGKETYCYYNLALDKSVKLDFPNKNFNPSLHPYPMIPQKEMSTLAHMLSTNNDKNGDFRNRTYLMGYDPVTKKSNGGVSLSLQYYLQDRAAPYQILSMRGLCLLDTRAFRKGLPAIWLGKNPDMNYLTEVRITLDHYFKFIIPQTIADQIIPYMDEYYVLTNKSRRNS